MEIVITRYHKTAETIDGNLSVVNIFDREYLCDTAENAHTALPAGTYTVIISKCKQQARKMPIVLIKSDSRLNCRHCPKKPFVDLNTPMPCICHQIKPGNGVYHRLDGSIIVGRYLAPGCLMQPRPAFDKLYERIRKEVQRGKGVKLIIYDQFKMNNE